jgi:hypothetical protein
MLDCLNKERVQKTSSTVDALVCRGTSTLSFMVGESVRAS